MSGRRIAVTGVGIVSALGQTAPATFSALMRGERGLSPLSLFDPGDVRSRLVGEVKGLRVTDVAGTGHELSRTDAMAVAAAREAVKQARLAPGARLGVALGGTTGGMFETEAELSRPDLASLSPARAEQLMSYPLSASLAPVAAALGGVVVTRSICSACSSGAIALVQGAAWLERGEVDHAIVGGADGLCRLTVLGFNALGATDAEPCRPFDRARGGLNLGEGAAVLVLEREASAQARGAEVLAWLDGYAVGAEAHHITHPDASAVPAAALLRAALARAGRSPAELGYVNAHGTGTQQNDAMEARALLDVLGASAGSVWVSSSKAQLGHTLGASGAVEAAITVLALSQGAVPPSVGLSEPELAGLRHVRAPQQRQRLDAALSSSFGFGGMSCVLALAASHTRAPERAHRARPIAIRAAISMDAATEPEKRLDPERSRRFDRASSFAALGAELLRRDASTGLVLGTAFGAVERTMAFLARASQRGPRHVPPAEFPHLVPSAPAGNASVYAGLTGPVFAVSDLAQSGEAAVAAGADLLELGVASRIVVGACAPRDSIVERVLGPLLDPGDAERAERGEGAGFLLLEALAADADRSPALALLLGHFQGPLEVSSALSVLPAPEPVAERCLVLLGASSPELLLSLEASSWSRVARRSFASAGGYHEALGAVVLAHGAELAAEGRGVERVLVLSGSKRAFSAFLLGPSPREPES
ncbi:MAG TPA: beta-ketoacyl-[acyl-carrier-protein] synthase family protein [Polyangiaceae bacterium]